MHQLIVKTLNEEIAIDVVASPYPRRYLQASIATLSISVPGFCLGLGWLSVRHEFISTALQIHIFSHSLYYVANSTVDRNLFLTY